MTHVNLKTLCPLPWLHLSSHLDSTMRICCNTDNGGLILDNDGAPILLENLENISEYFNLNHYKKTRKQMIQGQRPSQCEKCYKVEDNDGLSVRQSYLKKYSQRPDFDKYILETKNDGSISPRTQSLDFSLSNKCNLKCIMCSPDASYLIKPDWQALNIPYSIELTEGAHTNWKNNPALPKLIPEIAEHLEDFLTTGGEPFLNTEHFKTLELLVESGHSSNINLIYHTNCTVKNEKLFLIWNSFKSVHVHFSIDAIGTLNEYIRKNTKWKDVEENVKLILAHPKTICEVHTTIQVLNIFNLPELYQWIGSFPEMPNLPFHIWMDSPEWLKLDILPKPLKVMALNNLNNFFNQIDSSEPEYLERKKQIISYLKRSIQNEQNIEGLNKFRSIIRSFEKMRNQEPIEKMVPFLKHLF